MIADGVIKHVPHLQCDPQSFVGKGVQRHGCRDVPIAFGFMLICRKARLRRGTLNTHIHIIEICVIFPTHGDAEGRYARQRVMGCGVGGFDIVHLGKKVHLVRFSVDHIKTNFHFTSPELGVIGHILHGVKMINLFPREALINEVLEIVHEQSGTCRHRAAALAEHDLAAADGFLRQVDISDLVSAGGNMRPV